MIRRCIVAVVTAARCFLLLLLMGAVPLAALAALAIASALAGCGGGGDSHPTAAPVDCTQPGACT